MTRGREVSTTSPRLASTRMFWIIFSSSASCRLAKPGSLRGTRTRVSAPLQPGSAFLRWPSLCCTVRLVLCVDSHLTPHPPSTTKYPRCNFTDIQIMA